MAPEDQFALGEAGYEDSEAVLSMTGLSEYRTLDVKREVAISSNLIRPRGKGAVRGYTVSLERAGSRHFEALFRAGESGEEVVESRIDQERGPRNREIGVVAPLGIVPSLAGIVPSLKRALRALFWARVIPKFFRRALEGYGSIPDGAGRALEGAGSIPLWARRALEGNGRALARDGPILKGEGTFPTGDAARPKEGASKKIVGPKPHLEGPSVHFEGASMHREGRSVHLGGPSAH